jgi:hypothetical protein
VPVHSRSSEKAEKCGVGITFVEDQEGALVVKSLVPGGPAARSGNVMVMMCCACSIFVDGIMLQNKVA